MLYPVKKIVENLKKLGVLTLIDGAHAAGHAPDLNLEELGMKMFPHLLPQISSFLSLQAPISIREHFTNGAMQPRGLLTSGWILSTSIG